MHSISKNEKKHIKSLAIKKYRQSESLFVVEGVKPVEELVATVKREVVCIYKTPKTQLSADCMNCGIEIKEVSEVDLKSISNLKNPQGVLAISKFFKVNAKDEGLTLVLDNIQDPGNLGTIIRSAEWYGIKEIVCSDTTVDCFNPKVVQAAMGSLFRVAVSYTNLQNFLPNLDAKVYGALLEGENVYNKALDLNGYLIMGNEGNGISYDVLKHINQPITIPCKGETESLNVSIATAILLSEFSRSAFQ